MGPGSSRHSQPGRRTNRIREVAHRQELIDLLLTLHAADHPRVRASLAECGNCQPGATPLAESRLPTLIIAASQGSPTSMTPGSAIARSPGSNLIFGSATMFRINLLTKAIVLLLSALVINFCGQSAHAQEFSFTHQEHLISDGQVVNDPSDLGFTLDTSLLLTEQSPFAQPAQNVRAFGGSYTIRKQAIGAGEFSGAGSYRLTGTVRRTRCGGVKFPSVPFDRRLPWSDRAD